MLKTLLKTTQKWLFENLSFKTYLKVEYFVRYHSLLRWNNPKTFNEKIFWLRDYYENMQPPLMRQCYDKINVREYITSKLGEEYCLGFLKPLLSVYDSPEEIDFSALPDKFVLKVSQSSGFNLICPDKNKLDIPAARNQLSKWLETVNNPARSLKKGFVFDGKARILCEEYISLKNGTVPYDLRIYCFNGEPKLFVCDIGTTNIDGTHGQHIVRNTYDLEWNLLDVDLGRPHNSSIRLSKPDNLEEILFVAKKLSEDFIFVRVDLYNLDNCLRFGELTWIPMGGYCPIHPKSYDELLGSWLQLPK